MSKEKIAREAVRALRRDMMTRIGFEDALGGGDETRNEQNDAWEAIVMDAIKAAIREHQIDTGRG